MAMYDQWTEVADFLKPPTFISPNRLVYYQFEIPAPHTSAIAPEVAAEIER